MVAIQPSGGSRWESEGIDGQQDLLSPILDQPQIWDLLYENRGFSPAEILAVDPVKRPHWLLELEEPVRETIEAEARRRFNN